MNRSIALLPTLWLSSTALACPVCGGGGANQDAYVDMTMFLSLLPLTILGVFAGVVWYFNQLGGD
ncbi:MAG TPA: hypothetical protein PKA64_03110 [Myxococcota bacterium]|nr:hypothetical protein [Myxococcota bacterium]